MNEQKNLGTVIMMMDMVMHMITGKMKWNKIFNRHFVKWSVIDAIV